MNQLFLCEAQLSGKKLTVMEMLPLSESKLINAESNYVHNFVANVNYYNFYYG